MSSAAQRRLWRYQLEFSFVKAQCVCIGVWRFDGITRIVTRNVEIDVVRINLLGQGRQSNDQDAPLRTLNGREYCLISPLSLLLPSCHGSSLSNVIHGTLRCPTVLRLLRSSGSEGSHLSLDEAACSKLDLLRGTSLLKLEFRRT